MEELFLGAVLACEELDVIDQQRVDLLELALELIHGLFLQGPDHGAEELLRTQVQHLRARIGLTHRVAGGEHQVGLAQAGAPVQQQRIVRAVARLLRRLECCGQTQLVAAAFDEVGEGVVVVQVAGERDLRLHRRLRRMAGNRRDLRVHGPRARADFKKNVAETGKVGDQLADPRQVQFAHLIDNEGIRCIQHQAVSAQIGLQRLQPGVNILGRELRLESLETT
ncbi:hypothetical protein D3C72_1056160 [compost metagenome]